MLLKNQTPQKMSRITFIYMFLLIAIPISSFGQDSLTLKTCLSIGLENNYSLQITQNDEVITQNNLNFAKYAFFPTVDATGRKTNSVVNSRQEFASGGIQEKDNAKSNSLTGAISLNWTVFDGFGMFVGFDKMKELSELGKLNTRMTIENLTAQIASGYYNLIQQTQILQSLHHGMKLSSERLAIASEKYKIGSFSKLEFLQAQVDFNTDSSQYLRQEETVATTRLQLSRVLAYSLTVPPSWNDSISVSSNLVFENLYGQMIQKNTSLLIAKQNQYLSNLDVKMIRSRFYPTLTLNGGYNFTNAESQSGFLFTNRTLGYTYGATLTYGLFNRLDNHRQMKNAIITRQNQDLEFENLQQEIISEFNIIWNNYTYNLRLLSLETQNLESARENMDIAMAKYRLGGLAGIEMREIQKNFLDANNRFINAKYLAKIAEITLKQISGSIEEYY